MSNDIRAFVSVEYSECDIFDPAIVILYVYRLYFIYIIGKANRNKPILMWYKNMKILTNNITVKEEYVSQ